MYTAAINGTKKLTLSIQGEEVLVDGKPIRVSKSKLGEMRSHWIVNEQSMNVELVAADSVKKEFSVKVNNRVYTIQLKDRFDELLQSLGMEAVGTKKMREIKAPMPGMVLNVLVSEGDVVEKDTPLLILEAMKMENVIKSASEGTVKKVLAIRGVAVEKGAVLVEFQ